jgi:hypothetical protein
MAADFMARSPGGWCPGGQRRCQQPGLLEIMKPCDARRGDALERGQLMGLPVCGMRSAAMAIDRRPEEQKRLMVRVDLAEFDYGAQTNLCMVAFESLANRFCKARVNG